MPAIRRPLALAAALATTAALGLPAVALAADATTGPKAGPRVDLKDGTLDWGVKESFRKYVTGIALGTIETSDGAEQAPDNGPFTFSGGTGSYDTTTHAVATTFRGAVRFHSTAHGFDIRLADLKVATKGTGGAITADVTASGETRDDVPLATLDLSEVEPGSGAGGAMTFAKIPTKLTADGAAAFNGMYQEGQELDPATLSVTPAAAPGTPPASPEPTGKPAPDPGRPTRPADATTTGSGAPHHSPRPAAPASPAAAAPPAASGEIADGTLDWGVKKSFRDYVTGPSGGGKAETAGGAKTSADGFRFPSGHGTYDTSKATLSAAFNGSVRFLAHSGALDMTFARLTVKVNGTKGTLLADVSAKSRESGKVTHTDAMPVANLTVPSGALTPDKDVITLTKVPAKLTAAGAKAFDSMYKEGQELDPLTLAVALNGDARLPSGSGGSGTDTTGGTGSGAAAGGSTGGSAPSFTSGDGALADTGAHLPAAPLLGGAALLIAAGAGTAAAARRRLR